jgi:hypothetical protein
MSLETFGFISDLVPTNPTGSDPRSQGDDHLRGIKATLQATFPHADSAINIKPDATKLTLGVGAEDALQIDAVAKTISALAPYQMVGNGPAFRAYLTGVQTIASTAFSKVALSAKEFDTNNNFDDSVNYRFTPTIPGYYQINATLSGLCITAAPTQILGQIRKNGVSGENFGYIQAMMTQNSEQAISGSRVIYFNGTTDYVELWTWMVAGANCTLQASCSLSGALVRQA